MRTLLINPYYPISEGPSPPLGLAFLAAVLERAGVAVKILDLVVFPYSKNLLQSVLDDFQPQMVGSTAVTMSFNDAIQVIQDVKAINPDIITVMGGPHVTFCAEETLNQYSGLDVVVMGEGEDTIVELTEAVQAGTGWDAVPGIVYRNGGHLNRTEERKPCIDVDSLPIPARHLLPLGRYRALNMAISMTTSRGCPFKCIFCVGRKMVGAKVRYRNPNAVVDELEQISRLGFFQINIADDLFTANKDHCIRFCDEIIRRELKIKWSSFARVDTVSLDVLKKMKQAGCTAVSFGIETGNAGILKTIRKGITLDQVKEAIIMCNEAGIEPCGSFILGLPGETPETLQETIAFGKELKELNLAYGFHLLAPFPGTRVREEADSYGLKILTNDWSEYHANRAIVETASVNKDMLDAIARDWEVDIEKWLGYIQERMESGEATEEEAYPLVNLERAMLIYTMMMEDILGKYGAWDQEDTSAITAEDALKELIHRFPDFINQSKEKIFNTLHMQFEKGNLLFRNENQKIAWAWLDYL